MLTSAQIPKSVLSVNSGPYSHRSGSKNEKREIQTPSRIAEDTIIHLVFRRQ